MVPAPQPGRRLTRLLIAAAVAAACSPGQPGRVLPPAPEPARAPALSSTPVGQVIPLGDTPEGLAVDLGTGLVAVALRRPDRLALVDGRAGRLLRLVPLSASARHLTIAGAGEPVLVPGEDTDLLLQVRLPAGVVIAQAAVGRQPHDADTAAGHTFVADELGGSVSVVDGDRVIRRFAGPIQPGGVAAAGDRVGVVDVRGAELFVYDATSLHELARLPAGNGPTHAITVDEGHLVVADTRGGALLVYALAPKPRQLARLALPGAPYGLAFDTTRHQLWVTLTASNELVRFEGSPLRRTGSALPTVRQPNSVAVDPGTGRVFVAGAVQQGSLQVIDP